MLLNSLRMLVSAISLAAVTAVVLPSAIFAQEIQPEPVSLECRQPLQQSGYWSGHRSISVDVDQNKVQRLLALFENLSNDEFTSTSGVSKVFMRSDYEIGGVIVGYLHCGALQELIEDGRWIKLYFWNPENNSETMFVFDTVLDKFYAYDSLELPLTETAANQRLENALNYLQL